MLLLTMRASIEGIARCLSIGYPRIALFFPIETANRDLVRNNCIGNIYQDQQYQN